MLVLNAVVAAITFLFMRRFSRGRQKELQTFPESPVALQLVPVFRRIGGAGDQPPPVGVFDEGYSAYLGAHLPLDQALDLTVRDIVPPLYYLILRVWSPFAGTSTSTPA